MGLRVDEPLVKKQPIPIWKNNAHKIKLDDATLKAIDSRLLNYLDTLPLDLQKEIIITSATGDKHTKNSGHYVGKALDFRMNDNFLKHLENTKEDRMKNKLAVLDPNHGMASGASTAPHIHLSVDMQNEITNDYFYGTKSKNDEHDHESQPIDLQNTQESQLMGLQSIPSNINYDMINEFKKLIEETKKVKETEKDDTALIEAKNKLTERDNAVKFIKELKLNYAQFTPGQEKLKYENGGTFDFIRNQSPNPTTNFEKRIYNNISKIQNEDGSFSTHKMLSWSDDNGFYAAPTIVEINGKLRELTEDEAIQYAYKTGELKSFKTEQEAQEYANNGYKTNTPLQIFNN